VRGENSPDVTVAETGKRVGHFSHADDVDTDAQGNFQAPSG
jgi:hypothetical protein